MTLFGTSAKFIDAVAKAGLAPMDSHRLDTVRTITSTGSPLAPESFDFVYEHIKRDVHLASISGGTDIVSCFVLGNPIGAVWRGEIQVRGLGMKVEVFDERGMRCARGQRGARVHAAVPLDAARVLERSGWRRSITRRISSATRACGITATTWS